MSTKVCVRDVDWLLTDISNTRHSCTLSHVGWFVLSRT